MSLQKRKLILIFVFFVFIDQISKFIAINQLKDGLFFLDNFFGLEFFRNYGFAFGIEIGNIASIVLTIFVLGLFLYVFLLSLQSILPLWKRGAGGILYGNLIPFILVFAGATSNLMDRIFRGFVVDFIRFSPIWILNIADIFILAGLIIIFIKTKEKKRMDEIFCQRGLFEK